LKIIKENNISTVIIMSSMVIISSLVLFISYFFISNQYSMFNREIKDIKKTFVQSRKREIKREVNSVIEYIKFKTHSKDYNKTKLQNEIENFIKNIKFGENKNNYVFAYKILNYDGGKKFAKMLINPNRQDLVGKYINDDYRDKNGKEFRKIFLKDIKKQGYSFVTYMYQKPNSFQIRPKVSYFRLYKDWDWVIAAGTYLDDIDAKIARKKEDLKKKMTLDITSSILIFLLFSLFANILAIVLGKQIEKFFKEYNTEIEKSKFIALGEMISNIAHQWRQPLSELSAIIMNIKFRYILGKLDEEMMSEKSKDAEKLLDYMSNTIDDFRNFFKPDKEKKDFDIKESLEDILRIIGKTIKNRHIQLQLDIKDVIRIYGYENEFKQVILNILTNAKDILVETKRRNPYIKISMKKEKNRYRICIDDNGGGVQIKPIEKIFEPYVSTKGDANGTGIGLYMSKIIIEKNMNGRLSVRNTKFGTKFTITLPLKA